MDKINATTPNSYNKEEQEEARKKMVLLAIKNGADNKEINTINSMFKND